MAVLISVTEGDVTQIVLADVGVQGATGPSSPASGTPFTPYGNIAATNVQTAIQELDDEKFGKAGGTVTGNLEIGTGGTLSFEGATADGFETTLAVIDPTADRTLTLPNVTGTFVTTGDTGTVTSTMLLSGTILDADVNASAAIAGTKISPDFGSQTIVTTGVYSAAAGSAAAPSITFTGDTDTGIYSPGANQVAISTNGVQRISIDSTGLASVGGPTGDARIELGAGATGNRTAYLDLITDTTYADAGLRILRGSTGADSDAEIRQRGTGALSIIAQEAGTLRFLTTNTERARIDSSGRLLVGTSTAVSGADIQAATSLSIGGLVKRELSKGLSLADNVATTYLTLAVPGGTVFSSTTNIGGEISYVIQASRGSSTRVNKSVYGKAYFSISRFWESDANNPISADLTSTDQNLSNAGGGTAPTITWAISTDAGTDNATKNVYITLTVDNANTGTITQAISGTVTYHTRVFNASDVTVS